MYAIVAKYMTRLDMFSVSTSRLSSPLGYLWKQKKRKKEVPNYDSSIIFHLMENHESKISVGKKILLYQPMAMTFIAPNAHTFSTR